jgi:uncharacterized coiled-coil protein SlyX
MSNPEESKKCLCYTCKYEWKEGECHSITMARCDAIAKSQAESRATLDEIEGRLNKIEKSQAENKKVLDKMDDQICILFNQTEDLSLQVNALMDKDEDDEAPIFGIFRAPRACSPHHPD